MTAGTPNFNKEDNLDPSIQHVKEVLDDLMEDAVEDELSPNKYVTLPDGTDEFLPQKDLREGRGDPYVEYTNLDGEVVREFVTKENGKFDVIGQQPHFEHEKHPADFDPRQKELGI